jgi:hypothetical protein
MARYYGAVGFATSVETAPGVWSEVIVEKYYYGIVIRDTRQLRDGQNLNDDLSVSNSISIVASAYASEHILAIRYVKWSGVLWKVSDVEVQNPRLILRLGEVYNGLTP